MLIDTHAHLHFVDFDKDRKKVIENARLKGVEKIILPGSNLKSSQKALQLAQQNENLFAAVGIHPHNVAEFEPTLERKLKKLIQEGQPVAIGETGLDFHQLETENLKKVRAKQADLFRLQIELSLEFDLPLIIHSRKAFQETLQVLKKYRNKDIKGVFHCYAGGKKQIEPVLALGFYFGIDGNLTYDEGLQNVVKKIPLDKILLETDSPELTPIPFRGLRNEPKNVKLVVESLAENKGLSFNQVAQTTTANALNLFNLKRLTPGR